MFLVVDLVPGRLSCKFHGGYHGDIVVLVSCSGRSQVIALRGSYNDGCRRQQFRWSLAEHEADYPDIELCTSM
jgi:hypothetical protein